MSDGPPELRALRESATKNRELYSQEGPNSRLLEHFPAPDHAMGMEDSRFEISITVPEFTCLCPMTAQPDYATIEINYVPHLRCVESKSLKLYMVSFRQAGMFHEQIIQLMALHLIILLAPKYLHIRGEFAPRGGISFHPEYTYRKTEDGV